MPLNSAKHINQKNAFFYNFLEHPFFMTLFNMQHCHINLETN